MESRNNEPISASTSAESLNLDFNGTKTSAPETRSRRPRACPLLSLLALFLHLISTGFGIALSALVVQYGLDMTSAGTLALVARILLFAASCMGPFYVFMHLVAARENHVKSRQGGGSQIFAHVSIAVAVLVMRLGLPIWIATVTLSALAAVPTRFDPAKGFKFNMLWIQLGVASLALLSLIILIIVTETTDRPFATSIFSKRSFIRGTDKPEDELNIFEPKTSREENRLEDGRPRRNNTTQEYATKTSYDRPLPANLPKSSEVAAYSPKKVAYVPRNSHYRSTSRPVRPSPSNILRVERPRTQILPQPLEAVYTAQNLPLPDPRDSPRQNESHFSWRPPTRDPAYSQQRPNEVRTDAGTRQQDEVSAVSLARRTTLEPAFPPPTMPLPPMPVQRMPQEMIATAPASLAASAPPSSAPEDPATDSQPDVPAAAPNSPTSPDGPYPPQSLGQATPVAEPQAAPPSIAQLLSALSTRAAARRRNSLIIRQADLAPQRQSIIDTTQTADNTDGDMAAMLFEQPKEVETAETPRPSTAPRDLTYEDGEPLALRANDFSRIVSTATSGTIAMMLQQSRESDLPERAPRLTTTRRDLVSEDGEPLALRSHPLRGIQRSNTDEPRTVRNFSRPRTRIPRGGDASDDEATDASLTDDDQPKPAARGRGTSAERGPSAGDRTRSKKRQAADRHVVRRSRSVPTLADRARARKGLPPAGEAGGSQQQQQQQQQVETSDRGRSTTREKQPAQQQPTARFSPFPKPTPDPAERKIKGLGQGSTRRRDERIARWREEVEHDDARPLGQDPVAPRTRETRDFVQAQRMEAAQRLG